MKEKDKIDRLVMFKGVGQSRSINNQNLMDGRYYSGMKVKVSKFFVVQEAMLYDVRHRAINIWQAKDLLTERYGLYIVEIFHK